MPCFRAQRSLSHASQRGFSALRWVFGLLASCVLLMLLAMVLIANWDWNSARPWVAQQVSKSTGREFRIEGDLSADWHWPQPLEQGFRRWIPGVTVQGVVA